MSATHTDHVQRLQEEMAAITKPLSDHYAELDRTCNQLEGELNALRKARSQLRKTLRAIDPELIPKNGKGKSQRDVITTSKTRIDALTAWFQERRGEINAAGGIHASGIISEKEGLTRDDWDATLPQNQASLSAGMRDLHSLGVLRLDHTGNGGAKYYKVV